MASPMQYHPTGLQLTTEGKSPDEQNESSSHVGARNRFGQLAGRIGAESPGTLRGSARFRNQSAKQPGDVHLTARQAAESHITVSRRSASPGPACSSTLTACALSPYQTRTGSGWSARVRPVACGLIRRRAPGHLCPPARDQRNRCALYGLKAHARRVELQADLEMHIRRGTVCGICRLPGGRVNVSGCFRRTCCGSGRCRANVAGRPLRRFFQASCPTDCGAPSGTRIRSVHRGTPFRSQLEPGRMICIGRCPWPWIPPR